MSQVTLYLPDTVEVLVRERAQAAGKSLSAYVTALLAREVTPPVWPVELLAVLDEGQGDIEIPEDPTPEDMAALE